MNRFNYEDEPQGAETFFQISCDKRTRRFLESIEDFKGLRVLEIGIGQGQFLKKISQYRPELQLYGVDISATAIEMLKRSNKISGDFQVAQAESLPFPDDYFDVVVMIDVLEHIIEPADALKEINRVLSPQGIFHLYFPCENEPYTFDKLLRGSRVATLSNFTRDNFGHLHHLSQKEIKSTISRIFEIRTLSYSTHWISQLLHISTLYIPKVLIAKIFPSTHHQFRDASFDGKKKKFTITQKYIYIAKYLWGAVVLLPTSLIYELEAAILKHVSLGAQGLHFTCIKK
jgi:ubiquinone/menaquinone biosynthesis C-methylase UbiE